MSCIAATAPTLLPLVIPAAIVAFRAAPLVWRSVAAAHEKRAAARANTTAHAPDVAPPEKASAAIVALPALG